MRISYSMALVGTVAMISVAGCSGGSADDTELGQATQTTSTENTSSDLPQAPLTSPEDELRESAENLDRLAADGDAASAYEYYSQRCKNKIGDVEAHKSMLDIIFANRTPEYAGVTVRINGSSAQVVTVDNSPTAPASSMEPRTWTYIDDRWPFDNC